MDTETAPQERKRRKRRKTERRNLTDKFLQSHGCEPAPGQDRRVVWDDNPKALGLRVSKYGTKSFFVWRRLAGHAKPQMVVLGQYPVMKLAEARAKASEACVAMEEGRHPREIAQERLQKEAKARADSVLVVAEDYFKHYLPRLRSAKAVELLLRREMLGQAAKHETDAEGKPLVVWIGGKDARWRDKPVTKITPADAVDLVELVMDNSGRHQARKVFANARRMFGWAYGLKSKKYGLDFNPFASLKPSDLFGSFDPRDRILSDDEIRLIWEAAERIGYPGGTLVRALMLTGQRLRELGAARWTEIENDILVVPAARMKGKREHALPLASEMRHLLETVPRVKGGTFIFSAQAGASPINSYSKMKDTLDQEVARLRAEARHGKGAEPTKEDFLKPWVFHDIRRTVRTRLSGLRIPPFTAELLIAHTQSGVQKVYDLHRYDQEKTEALTQWEAELARILNLPQKPQANVIELKQAKR